MRPTASAGLRGRDHHQQAEDGPGDAGRGGGGVQEGSVSSRPGLRQDLPQQQRPLPVLRSFEPMLRLLGEDLYKQVYYTIYNKQFRIRYVLHMYYVKSMYNFVFFLVLAWCSLFRYVK